MFAVILTDEVGLPAKVLIGFATEVAAAEHAMCAIGYVVSGPTWHVVPAEYPPETGGPESFVTQLVQEGETSSIKLIVALRKKHPMGLYEAKEVVERVVDPIS